MAKRRKLAPTGRAQQNPPQPKPKPKPKPKQKKHQQQQQQQPPTIPFLPHHRILLIGEGDLSFAASLVTHHRCTNLTATVLDKSPADLLAKYPAAAANIAILAGPGPGPGPETREDDAQDTPPAQTNIKLVYGVDATKPLPAAAARPPHDRIIFNFPHVGGKSTDVNRQVRHNQELIVAFFRRALAPPALLAPAGALVVTLFDAEPYTLWNIRDLARHAGLQLLQSFRFRPDAYPGYRHARTLGAVRSRTPGGAEQGGWRGEDRPARSYVFVRKGEAPEPGVGKKRARDDDDDDSESD